MITPIIKWKFRDTSRITKNVMPSYVNYIEGQVLDRHKGEGAFQLFSSPFIDIPSEEDFIDTVLFNNNASDEELALASNKYNYLVEDLEKYPGLFSKPSSSISELKSSLYNHQGNVWIPIISLKESMAYDLGLDTEEKWRDVARKIMPSISNALNIPESNLNYLVAFHQKPDAMQNKQSDAGIQPHLHFIIWEKNSLREKGKINDRKLDQLKKDISYQFQAYSPNLSKHDEQIEFGARPDKNIDSGQNSLLLINQLPSIDSYPELKQYLNELKEENNRRENPDIALSKPDDSKNTHYLSPLQITSEINLIKNTVSEMREKSREILPEDTWEKIVKNNLKNNPDSIEQILELINQVNSTTDLKGTDYLDSFSKLDKNMQRNILKNSPEESVSLIKEILDIYSYKLLKEKSNNISELNSINTLTNLSAKEILANSRPNQFAKNEEIINSVYICAKIAHSNMDDKEEFKEDVIKWAINNRIYADADIIAEQIDAAYHDDKTINLFLVENAEKTLGTIIRKNNFSSEQWAQDELLAILKANELVLDAITTNDGKSLQFDKPQQLIEYVETSLINNEKKEVFIYE